jgi:hypothetical protein
VNKIRDKNLNAFGYLNNMDLINAMKMGYIKTLVFFRVILVYNFLIILESKEYLNHVAFPSSLRV